MSNMNKVSVCVPIYNVEKYIERCAISLFEQTYPNIEYIFVNDCALDSSINILKSVIERYPHKKSNVRIISHDRNRGLAAARNTAVKYVTSEFLMHVDSDDWVEKDIVEKCVRKQFETNCDIVSVDIKREWKKLSESIVLPDFKDNIDMTIKLLNTTSFHSIYGHLIRTSLYKDNNIEIEEGLNMGEDYFIIPRLSYCAHKVTNLHEFLYHYNFQNENSYVSSFSVFKAEQSWRVSNSLKEFFKDKGEIFMDSIIMADVNRIYVYIKSSLKNHNDVYYATMCKRLYEIDAKYIRAQPFSTRILFYLKYKPLRMIYLKIASCLKSFYRFNIVRLFEKCKQSKIGY